MARSSECTEQYAQKVIDSAGIVRDAWLQQLTSGLLVIQDQRRGLPQTARPD